MAVYVGLDCGGSSTRVVAVDELGSVLYQGQGGSANLASTPEKLLANNLRKATVDCPQPTGVCGCFAGLLTKDDRERGELHLRHLFPYAAVRAEPDYAAALFANEPFPDLCVICGTGSLICSRAEGNVVKSGGGGYILGDIGSAYQFGRDALRHFLYSPQEPSSRLVKAVEEFFTSTEANQVIAKVYRTPSPAALIAKFARPLGKTPSMENHTHCKALIGIWSNWREWQDNTWRNTCLAILRESRCRSC